jgi:ubiquinone/menaquinone biosynthesis C-methylase UbiE
MAARQQDKWSQWLLATRSGGEPGGHSKILERLASVRDRVLANALIKPGSTLLDVGTGDGLIGLAALDYVGANGHVVFSDISEPCIAYVKQKVSELAAFERTSFAVTPAESLDSIETESVDVVTTRSVLIYVVDKAAAFKAFNRVLRHAGIISLAEPINRDYLTMCAAHPHEFYGYDLSAIAPLSEKINGANTADAVTLDSNPMTDFNHLDLAQYCEREGFRDISVETALEIKRRTPRTWSSFINSAPNPNAATIGEEIRQPLTDAERALVETTLKPLVENGFGVERQVMAYVRAVRA